MLSPLLLSLCLGSGFFAPLAKKTALHGAAASFNVTVLEKSTGRVLCEEGHQETLEVYPASAMKVFVVATVLRKIDEGALTLETPITITQTNANVDCGGSCGQWSKGKVRPLKDLLRATIIDSHNITTNQLMDLVGKDSINDVALEFGAASTVIRRKVYGTVDPEPEIKERNSSSAKDLTTFYQNLHTDRGELLSETSRRFFLELLRSTRHNDRLNATYPKTLPFYHKTGSTSRAAADAGYFEWKDRVVFIAGLIESPGPVRGGRWDFQLLVRFGRDVFAKLKR